jgi:hypothetical protein
MRDTKFLGNILNYNTDNLSKSVIKAIQNKYLDNKAWVISAINNASKAAGPLAKWVES